MWRAVERLSREGDLARRREQLERGESPFLASAKLKLVDGCNLGCFMCDYPRRSRQGELSTDEVLRLLADLRTLGCEKVHFSGGEPFLRTDALALIARAHALGVRTSVTTNGTLLGEERLRALLEIPPRSVTVSIDSPAPSVHDALRGRQGAHRSATRTLDRLLRWRGPRTRVRVNTVVSARNVESLLDMPSWLEGRALDQWLLLPLDPKPGRNEDDHGLDVVRFYTSRVAPVLAERVRVPGFDPWIFGRTDEEHRLAARAEHARGHYRAHRCHVPWFHVLVDAPGDVYPCCTGHRLLPSLGNVRERPIAELFSGPAYVAFRRALLRERTDVCHRCDDFLGENKAIDALLAGGAAP